MTKTHRIAANKRFGLTDANPLADEVIGAVDGHEQRTRSQAMPGVDQAELSSGQDGQRYGRPEDVVKQADAPRCRLKASRAKQA